MRRILFALVISLLAGLARAEDPVQFTDEKLKAAVEDALWILDPTPTDMLGLTELTFSGKVSDGQNPIVSLGGLEYATNLSSLNLRCHRITDISPLSGLSNLQTLNLDKNQVSDISPLAGLMNLQTLILRLNNISDASPLSGLNRLQTVSLHRNQISDISPLTALTTLKWLDLRINPLSEEAYNTLIPEIVANNPGIWFMYDPSFHRRIIISAGVGGHVTNPGEGAFTYLFDEYMWLVAKPAPYFVFSSWSGTVASGQNPIYFLVDQDYHILANFKSVLNRIYVDAAAQPAPGPEGPNENTWCGNGTPEHPFDQIQDAIEVAARGASIVVRPGVYRENINLYGKNICLTGIDPNGTASTSYPVIESRNDAPAVSFVGGEGRDCMLTGFVITRGKGQTASAICCSNSSPTIANCLIVGNRARASDGAAIRCTRSQAAFRNCTIADNGGGPQGAGLVLMDSSVEVTNSILWGNSPNEILALGDSAASIRYSDVRGGWLDVANLDVEPLFARPGVWANPKDPNEILAPQDERAIWTEGDYHLKSQSGRWDPAIPQWVQDEASSPCLDRGDPAMPVEYEPAPNGDRLNLGAYGGTTQASKSSPEL